MVLYPYRLKILNLSANHLTHVSKVLFTLPNLNTLKVSHNHLRSLPIGDASNNWSLSVLKHLDVSHNKLNGLPLSFKQLQYLKTLDVSYNELKELPGNWSSSLLVSSRSLSVYFSNGPCISMNVQTGQLS